MQVPVCHRPGTPDEKTLTLPEPAVHAHIGHGDRLGACVPVPGPSLCPVPSIFPGPDARLTFQDTGAGPLSVDLIESQSTNVTVVPAAAGPTTEPTIEVIATRVNSAQPATFVIFVKVETESASFGQFCTNTL